MPSSTDYQYTPADKKKFKEITTLLEQAGYKGNIKIRAALLWKRWKCQTDLWYFVYEFLGLKNQMRRREGGREVPLIDPKFHRWMCACLDTDEDVLMITARGHLKSMFVKGKIMQLIIRNPNLRIGMFSVTADLVRAQLRNIKMYFRTPQFQNTFPEIVPAPGKEDRGWERSTEDRLTLKRTDEGIQGDQIEVYGTGGTVTGHHTDINFYDDLVNQDTTRTLSGVAKTREWYGYIQSVLEPGGQEIMTCTPYHYSDLSHTVREEGFYKNTYVRPAIENGKPVYSFFTLKMLEKLKQRQGTYLFNAQYMCEAIAKEDQIFPPPQPTFDILNPGEYKYYMSVDPAATTEAYSDETAFCIAAMNVKDNGVWIIDSFGLKKRGEDLARVILEKHEQYDFHKIGIEAGLQMHLIDVIRLVKNHWEQSQHKRIDLPIVPLKVDKRAKFDRINLTLGSMVRTRRVLIHEGLDRLMEQMSRLTPNYQGKDDLVDAAAMVFSVMDQAPDQAWQRPAWEQQKSWMKYFKVETSTKYDDRFAV